MSLQVGLGQAQPLLSSCQRRQERREAEGQVKAGDDTQSTAEEDVCVEEENVTEREKSEKCEIEYKVEMRM